MSVEPKNKSARAVWGNSPATQPDSAVANCHPGLEMDFRHAWKKIFVGVELHEIGFPDIRTFRRRNMVGHRVVGVEEPAETLGVKVGDRLVAVGGHTIQNDRIGYRSSRDPAVITDPLELSNALADLVHKAQEENGQGRTVHADCTFSRKGDTEADPDTTFTVRLEVRAFFDKTGTISEQIVEPGDLTQSLCSPWQLDYRECLCFFWASSRPDYVVAEDDDGAEKRFQWLQKNRSAEAAYEHDQSLGSADHVTYNELYKDWEGKLRFVVKGREVKD